MRWQPTKYDELSRNFAKLVVWRELLHYDWEIAMEAFSQLEIMVLRAEFVYMSEQIEYDIYSPHLPLCPDGKVPLVYELDIELDSFNKISKVQFVESDMWNNIK